MAEGDAAIHAARALILEIRLGHRHVDFVEVLDADENVAALGDLTFVLHESGYFTHVLVVVFRLGSAVSVRVAAAKRRRMVAQGGAERNPGSEPHRASSPEGAQERLSPNIPFVVFHLVFLQEGNVFIFKLNPLVVFLLV